MIFLAEHRLPDNVLQEEISPIRTRKKNGKKIFSPSMKINYETSTRFIRRIRDYKHEKYKGTY